MQGNLYSNVLQARRVTAAAVQALASTEAAQEISGRPNQNYLSIPAATLAGTVSMWSMYDVMLHKRATELVERPCRKHGIEIQTLGEYPLFTGTKLVHGRLSDVVIVPAEEDPLITTGKFPLPKKVDQRLRAMQKAGVPFDMIRTYIAHEVPPYSIREEGPIPLEVIAPPHPEQAVRLSNQLGFIADAATTTLVGSVGRAAKAAAGGTGAVAAGTAIAASFLLDPLIFGAIADERGMATWFVLAQWAW